MLGAVSDLQAADARYHVDCKAKFMTPKYIRLASKASNSSASNDTEVVAFENLCGGIQNQKSRVWNSVELFKHYTSEGGEMLTRRRLLHFLKERFGDDLIILTATGISSIVLFRSNAPALLNITSEQDDDDIGIHIKKVAQQIQRDCNGLEINKKTVPNSTE